ncbi:MAG TPA: panthothenate synthetase [Phycisphaerae bacterium]|nr:panthothenate synthetase [Phycisphaerae bacterium]
MRFLLNVRIPHREFNAAVMDGSVGSKISRILEHTKPEAVYFTEQHGQRGAVLVVDLADPSKIPALAEPWFLTFHADVEFRVAMTPDDLQKAGLEKLGQQWA